MRPRTVILGLCLLTFQLGALHAFSVLMRPLEQRLGSSRAEVSLSYALALVALTLGVLYGHRYYARFCAARFCACVALVASVGCLWAAGSHQIWGYWLSYGLLFGAANGLGYGFALQLSAQALPQRTGLAMGMVTAAYALGSVLWTVFLQACIEIHGPQLALSLQALCLLLCAWLVPRLLKHAQAEYQTLTAAPRSARLPFRPLLPLWASYGCAVAAGLMAMAHAMGMAEASELPPKWAIAAPLGIAILNMLGSLLGGYLTDRLPVRVLLMGLPSLSALALLCLAEIPPASALLAGLAVVGFCYGATITVYPAMIRQRFGPVCGAAVYGQVFTAWGLAGLCAPWLAGALFDLTQSYRVALWLAAALALLSFAIQSQHKSVHNHQASP